MAPTAGIDPATQPDMFRECCWLVEKRGCVGETTFHICFLMQSPVHLALGRRLLKHYPKLINDVYLSEEYYGKYKKYIWPLSNPNFFFHVSFTFLVLLFWTFLVRFSITKKLIGKIRLYLTNQTH